MKNAENTRLSLGKRLKIWIVDVTAVFFFFHLVRFLIAWICLLPFFPTFLVIWLLYYMIAFGVYKQTLGTAFFGVHMISPGHEKRLRLRIFLRECTSLPAILLFIWACIFLFDSFFRGSFLLALLIAATYKRKIFNLKLVRNTDIDNNKEKQIQKQVFTAYLILLLCGTVARYFHTSCTNDIEKMRVSSMEEPYRSVHLFNSVEAWDWSWHTVPRPMGHSVKKYVNFLKNNRQNINDYIFSLFDEYDHVILCERLHPEMTQYDMIYDLVTDSRFADRVGTVFTERGNVDSGASYRELMETSFADDTSLEQALSSLMMKNQTGYTLWCNTNWFNFLKKMYYYNQDKEQKADILFTDLPIWKFNHRKPDRDKIMADNIISTIKKENLNKSLTIMNSRYAYLIDDGKNKNCGYYISKAFPGKVANVLINTTDDNKNPLQRGKWDVAFEQMHEEGFAFHLSDSPFGKDNFDHYTSSDLLSMQTYEEMFTGVIFYKPLYKHIFGHGFPYMMQPDNMEILQERIARFGLPIHIDYYSSLGSGRLQNCKETYFKMNLLDNCFFVWNLIIGFGMLLYLGIVYRKTEKE